MSTKRTIISEDGEIDFSSVFVGVDNTKRRDKAPELKEPPLYLELGAGSGDWIVSQAQTNRNANYVSVELRADRVAQTFAKSIINTSDRPLVNLCCVGSECASFLGRVKAHTIARVFVNHPEPPLQTGTFEEADVGNGNEHAHMLNSSTLAEIATCMKSNGGGEMIIVTDNRWYASLISKTLLKIMEKR